MPPKKVAAAKAAPAASKRKASEISKDEPKAKKAKTTSTSEVSAASKPTTTKKATKTVVQKPAPPKKAAAPKKTVATKKAPIAKIDALSKAVSAPKKVIAAKKATAPKNSAAPKPAPAVTKHAVKKAAAPKKAPAPKKPVAPRAAPKGKVLPVINKVPTQKLDIFVFGEGSAGELGLGARKYDGKKPMDVKRPRINHLLSAKSIGVVALAVGGMHTIALTHDNKLLSWGVNDQGALGRETTQEGKMKDITKEDDSDSDSDDESEGLNPSEAEPREIDSAHFPEGTKFAFIAASDSASFVVTDEGLVYGWGTFRGNDGILGFKTGVAAQRTPVLIPELKNIIALASGVNHILALDNKGKVFAWGAGEQDQLARRVVARTAAGALIPREFGLQRKQIVTIGCGDYHSFAVDKAGKVYAWGLNTFCQTGVPKGEDDETDTVKTPTIVDSLQESNFGKVTQITGGAHHTLALTNSNKVLVLGRVDNAQLGVKVDNVGKEYFFYDEREKPRYLVEPFELPQFKAEYISAATDTCLCISTDGEPWSWGFSTNYQTGLGTTDEVLEATQIANTAVTDREMVFCGVGGQFGVLAAQAE